MKQSANNCTSQKSFLKMAVLSAKMRTAYFVRVQSSATNYGEAVKSSSDHGGRTV
jgi:hypothetical protein